MGAKHVINPDQLTLFERAGDLADPTKFYPGDAGPAMANYYSGYSYGEIRDILREDKLDDAHHSGLYKSIEESGVKEPVRVSRLPTNYKDHLEEEVGFRSSRGMLEDGHHRTYSQADIDPDAWVPVRWGG